MYFKHRSYFHDSNFYNKQCPRTYYFSIINEIDDITIILSIFS